MKKIITCLLLVSVGFMLAGCGFDWKTKDEEALVFDTNTDVVTETDTATDDTTVSSDPEAKVDLSWTAPTTRTDGTLLSPSELAGYKVYYGTSPSRLEVAQELLGISSTDTTILLPSAGTYYFAVTAYDSNGAESSLSEVVSKYVSG